MIYSRLFFVLISIQTPCSLLFAQGQGHESHHDESHEFKHHRIAIVLGHGHVFGAEDVDNGKNIMTIPTWGFDYQYWMNSKFGVGLKK